jgi:hypothetical protein
VAMVEMIVAIIRSIVASYIFICLKEIRKIITGPNSKREEKRTCLKIFVEKVGSFFVFMI